MLIDELDTPALLVEKSRLQGNLNRYAAMAKEAGVSLRPHVKTHKTLEIARAQLEHGSPGLTVAKLSEAAVYVEAGFRDIFVAYPVVGEQKCQRAVELNRRARVAVGADSVAGVRGLGRAAKAGGVTVEVLVELDSGLGRSGTSVEALKCVCAEVMAHDQLRLGGLFTFRSTAFPGSSKMSVEEMGREEGMLLTTAADSLRAEGFSVRVVSGGSTPTAASVSVVAGVIEVRPGTYVFQDLMTRADGACRTEDLALTVLTTVVSRPRASLAITDAGSKTLAGDVELGGASLRCLAETLDGRGRTIWLNEEHGALELAGGWSPEVGERVRLVPAHVCTVVNLADELVVVDGEEVVGTWRVAARGCNK